MGSHPTASRCVALFFSLKLQLFREALEKGEISCTLLFIETKSLGKLEEWFEKELHSSFH